MHNRKAPAGRGLPSQSMDAKHGSVYINSVSIASLAFGRVRTSYFTYFQGERTMTSPSNRKFAVRTATISAAVLLLLTGAWAAQQAGILFPEMKAEKGTFKAPAEEIGKKTKQLWSVTTVAAAPAGAKPVEGKQVSVVGEIIDLSCYLQVGKHGE